MENNEENTAHFIQSEIRKVNIITTPGCLALGLGLYGKFVAYGNAFHPLLNNESVVTALLIFGIFSTLWGGYRVIKITSANKRKKDA